MHKIDESMNCYEGIHIFFIVISLIFVFILFLIIVVATLFYTETQPVQGDASARMEDNNILITTIFRLGIVIYSTFVHNVAYI